MQQDAQIYTGRSYSTDVCHEIIVQTAVDTSYIFGNESHNYWTSRLFAKRNNTTRCTLNARVKRRSNDAGHRDWLGRSFPVRSFSSHSTAIIPFHRRTFHFMAFDGTSTLRGSTATATRRDARKERKRKMKKKKTGKKTKKKIAGNWELNPDVNHSCSRGQARSGH